MCSPCTSAQPSLPDGSQKSSFQIDAGEAFSMTNYCRVCGANGRIRKFAQHAAMNCSLLIAVLAGIGIKFKYCACWLYLNDSKAK